MERVALDTSVCIEIMKNKQRGIDISDKIAGDELFLPSVSLFELLMRCTSMEAVEELAGRANILAFEEKAARKAGSIAKELRNKGQPIGINDVFIAATAMANDCALATLDLKDFSKIKGLKLVRL